MDVITNEDGLMAVRSDAGQTDFRTAEQWQELVTTALTTKVTVDGGMNEGMMQRYEACCTVDDPGGSVVLSGRLFLKLAPGPVAAGLLTTIPQMPNPRTLADFGYEVDEEGRLCVMADGLPKDGFIYFNETHFRLVREAKLRHTWSKLQDELGMVVRTAESDPIGGQVFCSSDVDSNARMFVLVCGLGLGRPGHFGKMLSTLSGKGGTMIPQIQRARAAGYSVVILDPNAGMEEALPERDMRFADQDWWLGLGRDEVVFGERDSDYHMNDHYKKGKSWHHTRAVWEEVIKPSAACRIAMMGHSAGGSCLISLLQGDAEARERVKALVFSDCYELEGDPKWDYQVLKPFMGRVAKGWYIGGSEPIDSPIEWVPNMYTCSDDLEFDCVSSGCSVHNLIPRSAIDSMFEFIRPRLQ